MNQFYSRIVENLSFGVLLVNQSHNIVVWNHWLERASGLPKKEAIGRKVSEVCPCFAETRFKDILNNTIVNGQNRFCSGMLHNPFIYPQDMEIGQATNRQNMQIEAFHYQGEVFALIQISDITGQYQRIRWLQNMVKELEMDYEMVKESEANAKHNALYDQLTGLCNRTLLHDRLKQSVNNAEREQRLLALLFLDIDGFKAINDTYGHSMGDSVLKEVAARLKLAVRKTDTICRLGGDEYTILLPDIKSKSYAEKTAKKIIELLAAEFDLNGNKVFITVSIGISLFPPDGQETEVLLNLADSAMYSVKAGGKNGYKFYGR